LELPTWRVKINQGNICVSAGRLIGRRKSRFDVQRQRDGESAAHAGLFEKQITTADGRWFSVRIMPYRTMDDVYRRRGNHLCEHYAAKTLEGELREEIERMKKEVRSQKVEARRQESE